ncbi:hypothetical protein JXX18_13210 [Ruthenibacterium lactatiformans]|uniref:hypothetical protein n=1 Tax=Ruthenibacterium lactatiformans TaxID=1550024 RepID=UPI0019678462|nr:hypothetical protein [Ruthenibacterium lactatiformans]MBN3016763.1 hypothetical protein [Ruthenibacterium lactatiformans]
MITTNTLAQSQMTVMAAPTVEAELRRMAQEAELAFYANDDFAYNCHEVHADLARHFGLDAAQKEYRYYLWVQKENDAVTGFPFAAMYAVNVYGAIERHTCWYSDNAIASLFRMWTETPVPWRRAH